MNLQEESVELDGTTFKTQQFPAMKAFSLLAKLVKSVGPALGALMKMDPNAQVEGNEVLAAAFSQIDDVTATKLVPEILSNTWAMGEDRKERQLNTLENINFVFSGKLGLMFRVIGHSLKVNYADFGQGSGLSGAPGTLTARGA